MQKSIIGAAVASTLTAPATLHADREADQARATIMDPKSDAELEQQIEALKPAAPRITKEHIQGVIKDETYTRLEGTRTTVCRLELVNGFCVVGINNGPVSAPNFDQDIGCEYAYKAAVDQIWPLEGYLLAQRLHDESRIGAADLTDLNGTMDAGVWAAAYKRLNPDADEGLMLSWFANVAMAGYDEAGRRNQARVDKLRELLAIQSAPGTIDQGEYMRGMANGLVLALSVLTDEEPAFIGFGAMAPKGTTHVAKPVAVTARKIVDVKGNTEAGDDLAANHARLVFEDGTSYVAAADMTARYWPTAGDYLVRQEDGYEYLNPADVFARKYTAV